MISIPYKPTPKQQIFHSSPANEILYGGAAGGGKELSVDTLIPTPEGFVRMGDMRPGMRVFGPDGLPHAVTVVSPIRRHPGYAFVFDDGTRIVCNGEHLWFTYTAADLAAMTKRTDEYRERRRANRAKRGTGKRPDLAERNAKNPTRTSDTPLGSVKTADEIVATLRTARGRTNHAIPVTAPLELPERELPLAPYLLGLWLGDGGTSQGMFTSADGLEQCFAEAGFRVVPYTQDYMYGVNGIVQILRKIGVFGNKHVPQEYLWSSKEQRLAVLQGLMDTDGCCNANGSAEFCNENRQLAEDVAFLVRSLGMKCNVTEGRAVCRGKDCGSKYTVKFTPNCIVFRLERKAARQKTENRRTTRFRYLVRVENVPVTEMRCIAIDSADHLYLASEAFVPTHNTKAMIMDALFRCLKYPGTTACIFRRTYQELEDTDIKEAKASYPAEIAKYSAGRHEFALVNGSKILFRHCENEDDRFRYSGIEIQFLYFDELTSFEQVIYDFLKTRLRAKKTLGVVPIVRSASNPGGIGHGWVKKMFVDAAPYMQIKTQRIYSPALHKEKLIRTQYIPALATENPFITDDYIFELEQKPQALREALLTGCWDAFEGQVFTEWTDNPDHYADGIETHVINPFPIPPSWPRYMSFDHGYSKPFSVGWWAIDPKGRVYRYREWYGCKPRNANTGIEITPAEICKGILEREDEETRNNISITRVADPAIFDKSRGESVADQMRPNGAQKGIYFNPGDNTRMPGLMQFHERLRFREDGKPMLYVFNTCKDFIRTVPNLPYSTSKPEDIDSDAEDHVYDESRYFLMSRPIPGTVKPKPVPRQITPFDEV